MAVRANDADANAKDGRFDVRLDVRMDWTGSIRIDDRIEPDTVGELVRLSDEVSRSRTINSDC